MRTKEKHNGLMDKIITVLYWENTSDMYIQRYMGLFNRNHNDVLEDHGEKEETGRRTITEPTVV